MIHSLFVVVVVVVVCVVNSRPTQPWFLSTSQNNVDFSLVLYSTYFIDLVVG